MRTRISVALGLLPLLILVGPVQAQEPGGQPIISTVIQTPGAQPPVVLDPNAPAGQGYFPGGYIVVPDTTRYVTPPVRPLQIPGAQPPVVLDPNAPAGQGYFPGGYIVVPDTTRLVTPPLHGVVDPNAPAETGKPGCASGKCGQTPDGQAETPKNCWQRLCARFHGCCCEATHNDYGCGSPKADYIFVFGSCRAFWGDQCRKAPPKAYENWPGIFKP